jgi:saccharopine dehydrogenase-like NADP-dependent oxidoreductase
MKSVVVLGGYGNFGRRIVAALSVERECRVYVGGRDEAQAAALAREIGGSAEPLRIDCRGGNLVADLERVRARLVIHTAGPFQGQDYAVPRACIAAGAHYVDLADGRSFVCGISALQAEAFANDVLVVSGASTLPALSSAVIDGLADEFSRIDTIEHGIAAGARPPGRATMQGVLAYAGRPFTQWRAGQWQRAWGWQGMSSYLFPPPAGRRWLTRCDVPDLDLFPVRYPTARTVEFRAGVAPTANMLCLWLAAGLVRIGILRTLANRDRCCTDWLRPSRRWARSAAPCM